MSSQDSSVLDENQLRAADERVGNQCYKVSFEDPNSGTPKQICATGRIFCRNLVGFNLVAVGHVAATNAERFRLNIPDSATNQTRLLCCILTDSKYNKIGILLVPRDFESDFRGSVEITLNGS